MNQHSDADFHERPADRPQRLGASVYDTLLEQLMSRVIAPGDRIAVDSLVRAFGVSQTPIREALSRLEAQGLVIKTHLVGYRAGPSLSVDDFEALYAVRRSFEPEAAAGACRAIAAEELHAVDLHMVEMERLRGDGSREAFAAFARRDVEFHSLIADACGNRFLRDAIKSWSLQFHLFRRGYHPDWFEAVVTEHLQILEAIRARRPDAAADTMRRHIENSQGRFQDTMTAEPTRPNAEANRPRAGRRKSASIDA